MKKRRRYYWLFYRIHTYFGLFSFAFMIVIAISALNIQHHFISNKPLEKPDSQTIHLFDLPDSVSIDSLSKITQQNLSIFGYMPWWEQWKDDSLQMLRLKIQRPGSEFIVFAYYKKDSVVVEKYSTGLGSIIEGLHVGALGEPDSIEFSIWRVYAEISVILIIGSIIISLYFWFRKSIRTRRQRYLIIGMALFSITLIINIWLVG